MHLIHDLRNLLTVAARSVQNIQSFNSSESQLSPDLGVLVHCLDSMFELVDESLSTTEKLAPPAHSSDINQVIAERLWILRGALGRHVELKFEFSTIDGLVLARAIDLERVLLNLVLNASAAMPEGGVVTIATSVVDARAPDADLSRRSQRSVRVTVRDTGRGMPRAWEQQLFSRLAFDQTDGRGLGLASVNLIVLRLGGRFHVQSTEGLGTEVHMDLPQAAPWLPN